MTIKAKKSKINLREKLAELLNFRQIRDRLDGLGLYLGKDRTGTAENLAVRGGANIDDLQLAEISAALGGTAVDVFVYDTRNDSDGGKWRERTQHTSWYNEELNTATRGGRREFPAVAVIVAEADKVTIYDGDDPDLSMWMVFNGDVAGKLLNTIGGNTSLAALNGDIFIGCSENVYGGVSIKIAFISDTSFAYDNNQITQWPTGISGRDTTVNYVINVHSYGLVNLYVNDVAMTVLPNAPIDTETGLPVPTIAVATDGGVSVIRDDGSVVDITSLQGSSYNYSRFVSFDNNNKLLFGMDQSTINTSRRVHWHDIPSLDKVIDVNGITSELYTTDATNSDVPDAIGGSTVNDQAFAVDGVVAGSRGLTKVERNDNMFAFITSSYNTGWMTGDIKLATLSDTKIEKVGVDETTSLIENATDWTGASGTLSSTLPTGWETSSTWDSLASVAGKELTIRENNTTNYGIVFQTFSIEAEKTYTLKAKFKANTGNARVWIGTGTNGQTADVVNVFENSTSTYTEISHTFSRDSSVIGNGNVKVSIAANGENAEAVFDYVSITETGELITNGTFNGGQTGWTAVNGTLSINNGLVLTGNTSENEHVYSTPFTLTAGKTYVLDIDITGTISYIRIGSSTGLSTYEVLNVGASTGTHNYTFKATATGTFYLKFGLSVAAVTATIHSASLRLAEDDRSVNDNGLQVFGEIDKTPVAPGADLVAYSGFSADDYLVQPYNSDLDFGTGDFCVMGWFKMNNTPGGNEYFFSRTNPSNTFERVALYIDNSKNISLWTSLVSGGQSIVTTTGGIVSPGVWHFICATRASDGTIRIHINDNSFVDTTQALVDISFNGNLYLGNWYSGINSLDGSMALWRASSTIPAPEQIAKIYRDEKVLFQDGAQATLYGTSDAVTALAYDDKTELLHVGTSGGRSDFAGLRRINNTTTAVTTSISASNNLIAEQ